MSSLAATQADGYYLPPAYYESGAKSKNEWYAKQSGTSTAKASTTVRFELADPCECLKCHARIGRGTRFNAVKRRTAESYFSTPILEFLMSCRRCGKGDFIIRTDPKNRGFAYSGDLRKQERTWNAANVGGITVEEKEDNEEDDMSPVDRMEKHAFGVRNAVTERNQLEQLVKLNEKTFGDDVTGNAKLRDSFRRDRKVRKRLRETAAQNGWQESLTFVETNIEDESGAKSTVFGNGKKNQAARWRKVREASIFSSPTTKQQPDTTTTTSARPIGVTSGVAPPRTSSSSTTTTSNASSGGPRQKRRLVVATQGKKGVITASPVCTDTTTVEQRPKPSGIQSLVAGYGSSSDEEE